MKTKILLLAAAIFFASHVDAIDCGPTKIKKIETYKAHEGYWLSFNNGTAFIVRPDINDKGGKNVLSLAMSAFAMDANVVINLSDSSQCGAGGNATSWVTLKIVK